MPATTADDKSRAIIPRWRDFQTSLSLGELSFATAQQSKPARSVLLESAAFEQLKIDYQDSKNGSIAGDLLSVAHAVNRVHEVQPLIEDIIVGRVATSESIVRLAQRSLGGWRGESPATITREDHSILSSPLVQRLRRLKQRLLWVPRNAFDWIDAALLYESLGQRSHALRAIKAAIALGRHNRFIVRSAARFWIHRNDFEQAHSLLVTTDGVTADPWLLAAELATAGVAGRTSRHIKLAKRMIESGRVAPLHLSEVASAVATIELCYGNARGARKFFRTSLDRPTENAVAQASWAARVTGSPFQWEGNPTSQADSAEANALALMYGRDWDGSLAASYAWLADQPFSSRPVITASFLHSTAKDDPSSAIAVCRFGLRANPEDVTIRNNLAVALCLSGQTNEAENVLGPVGDADGDPRLKAVVNATRGMIAFRSGSPEAGRRAYSESIATFLRAGDQATAVRAQLMWLAEEAEAGLPTARNEVRALLDSAQKANDPGLAAVAENVQRRLAAAEVGTPKRENRLQS